MGIRSVMRSALWAWPMNESAPRRWRPWGGFTVMITPFKETPLNPSRTSRSTSDWGTWIFGWISIGISRLLMVHRIGEGEELALVHGNRPSTGETPTP
jgi:hypothetical protein